MRREKTTGWKVPLVFCCVILLLSYTVWLFMPKGDSVPTLPDELERQARGIKISLTDPEGKEWLDAITSAASGFADLSEKERKLNNIIDEALDRKRFDVACTALALLRQDSSRESAIKKIIDLSIQNCQTLPWAVFAYKAAANPSRIRSIHKTITDQWLKCEDKE